MRRIQKVRLVYESMHKERKSISSIVNMFNKVDKMLGSSHKFDIEGKIANVGYKGGG